MKKYTVSIVEKTLSKIATDANTRGHKWGKDPSSGSWWFGYGENAAFKISCVRVKNNKQHVCFKGIGFDQYNFFHNFKIIFNEDGEIIFTKGAVDHPAVKMVCEELGLVKPSFIK